MVVDDNVQSYISPIMRRLPSANALSIPLLRENIPLIRASKEAKELLAEGGVDAGKVGELHRVIAEGMRAQDVLVLASIPLVKHLASKEFERRRNWRSQVTYEELVQEGVSGLIRGLNAYKVENINTSATNYLGQWIVVEMRRNVEQLDNDFNVSYDASERYRKIRALRSRLTGELGREPTDGEIIEASKDPAYRGGKNMGRVRKVSTEVKALTQRQLDDERANLSRVGHSYRFADQSGEDSEEYSVDAHSEYALPVDGVRPVSHEEEIAEAEAKSSIADLVYRTVKEIGLGEVQEEIIARKYGLPPHLREFNPREIAVDVGLSREKVVKVVDSFSKEMMKPGGCFHKVCAGVGDDELIAMGLSWVSTALGDYRSVDKSKVRQPDSVLSEALRFGAEVELIVVGDLSGNVYGTYKCTYHKGTFVNLYSSTREVRPNIKCSTCGKEAVLVRLEGVVSGGS